MPNVRPDTDFRECDFFFFFSNLLYLKGIKEKKKKIFYLLIHLTNSAMPRAGPGHSQKPRTASLSPTWTAGVQAIFPGSFARSWVKRPMAVRWTGTPAWDAGIAGGGHRMTLRFDSWQGAWSLYTLWLYLCFLLFLPVNIFTWKKYFFYLEINIFPGKKKKIFIRM